MPQYNYKGRDRNGKLRAGQRFAFSKENLNEELISEGISPISIDVITTDRPLMERIRDSLQSNALQLEELAIFARQMQLLHNANVPIVTALKQLATHTRSRRLVYALKGTIFHVEK